jgi:hypothetical protein
MFNQGNRNGLASYVAIQTLASVGYRPVSADEKERMAQARSEGYDAGRKAGFAEGEKRGQQSLLWRNAKWERELRYESE